MWSSKVLLLENAADQAAAVRASLVAAGYRLSISRFEADGLTKAREWRPDIVVLASTYVKAGLVPFSRRIREEAGPSSRLVIASSLAPERLLEAEPDLKALSDGFVRRPYSPMKLMELLDRLSGRKEESPAGGAADGGSLEGKRVLLLDGDGAIYRVMQETLAPKGVKVEVLHWEGAVRHCRARPPQAVILGWPPPEGFSVEKLREIHEGWGGGEIPILLLSSSGREEVKAHTPVLLNMARMLFTKPVPWNQFFHFLGRILEAAPPSRPSEGGGTVLDRFQQEMEAKFLEVEELKRLLKEAEKSAGQLPAALRDQGALREESLALRDRLEAARVQAAVDLGKMRLREAELEAKLEGLTREKEEAESRARDLIDESASRREEVERALLEARKEKEHSMEEAALLRADLEKALVEKEQAEEKVQAALLSMNKEREKLRLEGEEDRDSLQRIRVEMAKIQEREAERVKEIGERERERVRLQAEVKAFREKDDGYARRLDSLRAEVEKLRSREAGKEEREQSVSGRIAELEARLKEKEMSAEALGEDLAERDGKIADLERQLESSAMAVAGLDEELSGLRHGLAESEAALAGMTVREARLAREKEDLEAMDRRELDRLRKKLEEEKLRSGEVEAELERLRAVSVETASAEERAERLEVLLKEREDSIGRLEGELREKEGAVGRLESLLEEKREEFEALFDTRERELALMRRQVEDLQREQGRSGERADNLEDLLKETRSHLDEERRSRSTLEKESRRALHEEEEKRREIETQLSGAHRRAVEAEAGRLEYDKLQQMLQNVIARAQSEVIERSRKEAEFQERLRASVEEKKFLLARLERELAEAVEREKRLRDALDSTLKNRRDLMPAPFRQERDTLPVILSPPPAAASSWSGRSFALAGLVLLLVAAGGWLVLRAPSPGETLQPQAAFETVIPGVPSSGEDAISGHRRVWEAWTRKDVSGGVFFQATLRSEEEIAAEVEAERKSRGWSEDQSVQKLARLLEPYSFGENYYFYLYLKNLQPGHPPYANDIYSHLALRDDKGNEAPAFMPDDMDEHRRVYSFTSGGLSKSRDELIYEVTVPVAFSRGSLLERPAYIELLAFNIGASSRRVLTWELK